MISRRSALTLLTAAAALPTQAIAKTPKEVLWADLIPEGVPYAEIIGQGDMDESADTWAPIFDENATKLNEALNGAFIRIPGFIVPLKQSSRGVTQFLLVPYVGACIHVPPPPANQLVLVNSKKPWPNDALWDPVWVHGTMRTKLQDTDLGQTGYTLTAQSMEVYTW